MRFARFLLALVVTAASVSAQGTTSKSASAAIGLTLVSTLNLSKTADMSLGSHFVTDASATTGGPGGVAAAWSGNTDVGTVLKVSFAIPATLVSGTNTIPFQCGISSGVFTGAGTPFTFNPSSANNMPAVTATGGAFGVTLGQSTVAAVDPTNCDVTMSPAPAKGVYAGTVTITVATQ